MNAPELVSACVLAAVASAAGAQPQPVAAAPGADALAGFTVRAGYALSVAVMNLPDARFLAFDDDGNLYCSRPDRGDVIRLRDEDGDGVFESRTTFVGGRHSVHAIQFGHGHLWFAASGSVHKARDTTGDGVADEVVDVISAGTLPLKGSHWWRSLLVTDDSIYTSIGDSGNISNQTDTERQKIWRFDLDGSNKRLFCSGVRNTEKLGVRPGAEDEGVWGFDHGSDWFGAPLGEMPGNQPITDMHPPEELNLYVEGGFYGHPFIVGNRLPRYEYAFGDGKREDILQLAAETIPPEWCVPAHWAVNGWAFIDPAVNVRTRAFPADHSGDVFFAAHGSWNSTARVGYCVGRVLFDGGKPYGMLKIVDCVEGPEQVVRARPVDCVQAPDGSMLFSADQPGRVYRVRWVGGK